jgi:transposase InsO family protein
VEIAEMSGSRVTIRDGQGRYRVVTLGRLVTGATVTSGESGEDSEGTMPGVGVVLSSLSVEDQRVLSERAAHVREVLTGYRSGDEGVAGPGEPRPEFAAGTSLESRYRAKAAELGVGVRTLKRWVAGYRARGEAGLVDERKFQGRGSTVDARWVEACPEVLAASVRGSTPTYSAVLVKAEMLLEETHGADAVPLPSKATAYRHLKQITKGTNAFTGSAKARRSIADRPKGTYGRLRATRPGEYVILDTQDLDVYAMEPVTLRWVPVQLTVAQDLFSLCILGLRLTPVSTKAVDVAGVLYQSVVPEQAPEDWPDEVCWPYHGIPAHLVFTEAVPEDSRLAPMPACPPETIVVDRGKQYLSAHVIGVCASLGISIQLPSRKSPPTNPPSSGSSALCARA